MARKPKMSDWYRKELAAAARARSRPQRPCDRKPGGFTDEKARDYAEWLARRDGVDLDALAEAERGACSTRRYATIVADVRWSPCAAGMRPRFVEFMLSGELMRGRIMLWTVELPNWHFEAAEPEDLSEPDEPEPAQLALDEPAPPLDAREPAPAPSVEPEASPAPCASPAPLHAAETLDDPEPARGGDPADPCEPAGDGAPRVLFHSSAFIVSADAAGAYVESATGPAERWHGPAARDLLRGLMAQRMPGDAWAGMMAGNAFLRSRSPPDG